MTFEECLMDFTADLAAQNYKISEIIAEDNTWYRMAADLEIKMKTSFIHGRYTIEMNTYFGVVKITKSSEYKPPVQTANEKACDRAWEKLDK